MKRLILYGLFGLLAYVMALVWLLPAERWFGLWQQRAPQWTARHMSGNIFAGSIQQLQSPEYTLGDLHWRWRPSALLRGHLGYLWQLSNNTAQLEGEIAFKLMDSALTLTELQGELPLAQLIDWLGLPPQAFTALLQTDSLTVQMHPTQARLLAADGLIIIKQVQATSTSRLDLGAFELQLTTESGLIQGLAQDQDSPLELRAKLSVQSAETNQINYQIQGELAARPQADETIRALIRLLGTTGADGKQHFDFRSQFLF